MSQAAKLKAPISMTSPVRVKLTLQESRLKCRKLESRIKEMQESLSTCSTPVGNELNQDFISLFNSCDQKDLSNVMKLFWEEQQKYIKSSCPSSIRYHPMIIKYCLSLAAKSSSAYSELRYDNKTGSGILVLPSMRTLRDYRNYIRPQKGFNPQIITELANKTKLFSVIERYVTILFDEMKI